MKTLRNILLTLLFGFIYYYFALPVINWHSIDFYLFIFIVLGFFGVLDALTSRTLVFDRKKVHFNRKKGSFLLYAVCGYVLVIVVIIVVNFFCSPLFNAKSYHNRIKVNTGKEFSEAIEEVNFDQIPLLDRDSSEVLGDRVMGQMGDLVSQYNVSSLYTQINYNDKIVRVTPLNYADFIKWINNRDKGIVGYITVNSVDGSTELVRLKKGMKYSSSAFFNDNIERKLRFSYPTTMFGDFSFEIDNEGNPYYIITTLNYTAFGLREKVDGVIIFDPITGKSKKYSLDKIPTWVDVAYSARLIIEQVDDWGTYVNGFFNSIFGQKNVVNTTSGYNYLAMNDDIYLYTGITSVVADESNLGFILTNMRTGETDYYNLPGAEEYSAMSSAEGQVQDMGYTSTFPLLINLEGNPTYLVSLKDNNGLVKMYGFIDVKDYQKVVVTDSSKGIHVACENYLTNTSKEISDDKLVTEELYINNIYTADIGGYTYYYIEANDKKYKISITLSDKLPFLRSGNTIKVGYKKNNNEIINVVKVY